MRGYLKSQEGVFQLAPKVTTIGREGCDLVIQTPEVDFQHAVIEYSDQEDCFVLQDLNTANGTYVNDCRVQNAAVRMAPGDLVRFGNSGMCYELEVDAGQQQMAYPPVHQRTAWTQPLTVIPDQAPPAVYNNPSLPTLKSVTASQTTTWGNTPQSVLPRPPTSIRSRPLSAGARRPYMERTGTTTDRLCVAGERNCYDRPHSAHRGQGGWVSSSPTRTITQVPQTADISILQEKEQRILQLNEEIRRLALYETECQRKEEMVHQFRAEISDLQGKIRQQDTSQAHVAVSSDDNIKQRLGSLENEVQLKRSEISSLKEQLNVMRGDERNSGTISRQDFNDRVLEMNSLKTELERVRKDKNITSGLVTQMQRDMANKDTTVSRLTRELESCKKELKEKDVQLSSLQAKFRRTQETKRSDEEVEARDKELAALRMKFTSSENKVQEQADLINALKEELEKIKVTSSTSQESQKQLQSDLDTATSKCQDVERSERMVRVDLEQVSKRLERFRSRVIQVTFSTPGIRAPDTEISDDELLDTLKKLIDERTDMLQKVNDLKDNVKHANSSKKDFVENSKKFKQQMNEALSRLEDKGQLSRCLRQELDLLAAVSLDEDITWLKEILSRLFTMAISWQADTEKALEESGVNVKLSEDAPSKHIRELQTRHVEGQQYIEALRAQISDGDNKHREEIAAALEALRNEITESKSAEIEAIRIEHEEKMSRCIQEVTEGELERSESALNEEQTRRMALEADLDLLKASLLEREAEDSENRKAAQDAMEAAAEHQRIEIELRELIASTEGNKSEELLKLERELENNMKRGEQSVVSFKEQIRQHSVTICAMEEKLNKVVKRNKDYQSEISTLKHTISELRAKKHEAPPKPKMIIQRPVVDVVAMETTVLNLQREKADLTRQLQEQHDLILNLRRDLSGASAKLSDMTGELSEAQKQSLEKSNKRLHDQDVELMQLRQQMVKLSQIVDKQNEETKALTDDLSKQRSQLSKYKNIVNESEHRVGELQSALDHHREDSKQSLKLSEEEGHITSELTALGAQCRGDRHEQVIIRQREALTELRARIKALELSKPPFAGVQLPTSDQALQQVAMLKKEVAELRASQCLQEMPTGKELTTLDQHINKARGMDSQIKIDMDHERSAHRETLESLELSEQSFLTLLRAIASAMELDDISGLRSMSHIPRDERLRLAREREAAVELLTSRIKVLMERIHRKDELLQGYEKDLAKLRQAEKLAEQKHAQVEVLANDMRSRTEESQYLRESLQRTKGKLEQEQRLNGAIKSKKTFHLENEGFNKKAWPRHHCPPEDIMGKGAAQKKASTERLKKKKVPTATLR